MTNQYTTLISDIKRIVEEYTYPGEEYFSVYGISDEMAMEIIKLVEVSLPRR